MNFSGKVVIITGAASGIGAGTAHHFAKLEAKLSLIDLNENLLNEVAENIVKAGYSKPLTTIADVSIDSERIVNVTLERFGQLDVLINNARIAGCDSVEDFDSNQYDRIMNINLKSMILLTNVAVKHLEKTQGNVVNVSSVFGLFANKNLLSYCISKAGINQFTQCAALSLASKGIRINAINPGFVKTAIYDFPGGVQLQQLGIQKRLQLVDKLCEPSDIARGIAYLASDPLINGILLPVDGGILCKRN